MVSNGRTVPGCLFQADKAKTLVISFGSLILASTNRPIIPAFRRSPASAALPRPSEFPNPLSLPRFSDGQPRQPYARNGRGVLFMSLLKSFRTTSHFVKRLP